MIFEETSLFKADRILRQLLTIGEKYPDCALDVTEGSDAACLRYEQESPRLPVPEEKSVSDL